MRSILCTAAIMIAGCAGHPAANPADSAPRQVKVDASNIVEVQKAGYTIVNKNGRKLYCTKDPKTGSHIQTTTACLTEQEWQQVREESQRSMQSISTQPIPPAGH
jgi:hypothetical protein